MLGAVDLGIADHGKRAGGEQAAQIAITLLADTAELFFASLECCFGTKPIQAEKSRPDRNAFGSAILATRAVASARPTPGISSSRLLVSCERCQSMIWRSAGSGTLVFHGRRYPLSIGGVSYGFTFGGAATDFIGTVSNIRRPSDVNGVYGAAGAGVAIGAGAGAIVLTNQNGAVLRLSGRQAGLIVAADLNGLVISLR